MKTRRSTVKLAISGAAAGFFLARGPKSAMAQEKKVYELRTYTTLPGKLPALLARFRDHTTKLFDKHGLKVVAYWVPTDAPLKDNTLIYVVEHKSREAAKKAWDAFRADPAWVKARTESEKDGKIVEKVESVYMDATDFSAMK